MKNIDQHIKDWTEENQPVGKQLGYPSCCITEFCNQPPEFLKTHSPTKDDITRYDAAYINGEFTGFFPCIAHAKQIIAGKITLKSLIDTQKRDKELVEFPFA